MAFSVGSITAFLKLDSSGFNKEMTNAQKSVADFSGKIEGGLKTIRNTSAVLTGIGIAVGAVAMNLGKTAGQYESIRDSFQSMTASMGVNVDEFQAKVAKASGGTLDNLTILTGGTRALSLMGKEAFGDFGTDFARMAELSKKASRATGQDVNYMFDSLILGMSRESKMILDNLGISVDLTQAKQDYAESLGKSAEELTISEQKSAVLNHTLSALETTYGAVAVSAGGFSGGMATFTTEMTNMKIALGTALLPLLNELVRTITPLIQQYLPPLIDWIRQGVLWFSELDPNIQKVVFAIGALIPVIGIVAQAILLLMPVITALTGPIGIVIAIVTALAIAWATNFMGIRDKTTEIFGYLRTFFFEYVMPIFTVFQAFITKHADDIKKIFEGAWLAIKGYFQIALAAIQIIMAIALGILTGDWQTAWTKIKSSLNLAWSGIKNVFEGMLSYWGGWAGMVFDKLTDPFQRALNKIREIVDEIKDKLDFTQRHSPSVVDLVEKGVRLVNNAFDDLAYSGIASTQAIGAGMVSGLGGGATTIIIEMDGAIIGDIDEANGISERIGDSIVRRLQSNVRV